MWKIFVFSSSIYIDCNEQLEFCQRRMNNVHIYILVAVIHSSVAASMVRERQKLIACMQRHANLQSWPCWHASAASYSNQAEPALCLARASHQIACTTSLLRFLSHRRHHTQLRRAGRQYISRILTADLRVGFIPRIFFTLIFLSQSKEQGGPGPSLAST
jgi:hypothetical protein